MADPLCIIMGIADILAGILIFVAFGANTLAIIFGIIMLLKGIMSFI